MRFVHSISWKYHASLLAEAASGPERERSPWSRSRVPGNELRTLRALAAIILGGGMRRYRSGYRVRSACALAVASLVLGFVSVAQVVAQQPHRVGRLLAADPCPANNIFTAERNPPEVRGQAARSFSLSLDGRGPGRG